MVVEKSIEELQQESQEIFMNNNILQEVQDAAKEFITAYENYQKRITTITDKPVKLNKNILLKDDVYSVFYKFQNKLNEYFHQIVKVLYVFHDQNGSPKIAILDNNIEALGMSPWQDIVYRVGKITTILHEEDYDSTTLDLTEQNIQYRWSVAKTKQHRNNWLPILWKVHGIWSGAMVNNLGTIAEAYAKFYVNKFKGFTKKMDEDVCIYICHSKYGVASVDNAPGLLIGDIDNISSLNLAVKKENASPERIKAVYEEVKAILQLGPFDPELMKNKFVENVQANRGQMKMLTGSKLAEAVKMVMSPLEKFEKS